MGRPRKHNVPYTGDRVQMKEAFQEYLSCVVDCFGAPYDDREEACDNSSLRSVCEEFGISIPKARKLLITAGVYSTALSRKVAELSDQGKNVAEIMTMTGLSRSSVSSYLPYQEFSYKMRETTRHAADSRKYRERKKAVEALHGKIINRKNADEALWQTIIAYQNYPFRTSTGLPFSYMVKCRKDGEYSGELVVSRKEESKTLTRSSVMLAFHTVLGQMHIEEHTLIPPTYKGPKAIGQIFGISYVYSFFWKWGLIRVPDKVAEKLREKKSG